MICMGATPQRWPIIWRAPTRWCSIRPTSSDARRSATASGCSTSRCCITARLTRAELVREPVDLTALAQSVATQLQRSDPERQVTMAIDAGTAAQGDARLLRIALENLMGNAWKFTSRRAQARIEVGATNAN